MIPKKSHFLKMKSSRPKPHLSHIISSISNKASPILVDDSEGSDSERSPRSKDIIILQDELPLLENLSGEEDTSTEEQEQKLKKHTKKVLPLESTNTKTKDQELRNTFPMKSNLEKMKNQKNEKREEVDQSSKESEICKDTKAQSTFLEKSEFEKKRIRKKRI